uniref:Uncharacterized protein n=1 Tax=Heliothis virescens TaxID=7102 RepID=A0A2A4K8D1_HELVI
MEQITLGTLTEWRPPAKEEAFFNNVVQILDEVFPDNWRAWIINTLTYNDLFGEQISSDLECSAVQAYNKFSETVNMIKALLISRQEASEILKKDVNVDTSSDCNSSRGTKRSHSPELLAPSKEPRIGKFMAQQNLILEKLCSIAQTTNENVRLILHKDLHSINSSQGTVSPIPDCNKSLNGETVNPYFEEDSWEAPPLINGPQQNEELNGHDGDTEPLQDFNPDTKETEAKITKADDMLVQQGVGCQRFNSENWQNIRYAEVQKQFQASPAFTALKVNGNLATVTPPWQLVSVLEKMDLCLGAVTHGLLQQRRTFQLIYEDAPSPVKAYISKKFLEPQSEFRKCSDSLLQYTCGKRAEMEQITLGTLTEWRPPAKEEAFFNNVVQILDEEASEILKKDVNVDTSSDCNSSRGTKRSHSPELLAPSKEPRIDCNKSLNGETVNPYFEEDSWEAPPLINGPQQNEELNGHDGDTEPLQDFNPDTKETEAKITKADDMLVQQGVGCQRFNSENWQNIRYAEVQKQFQASPAFTALKVNGNLATVTPPWQLVSVLEKMDLCLGAVTHGLLQQRRTFQLIYEDAPSPVKAYISKKFLEPQSEFRKCSDSLLQYTCGKRAEVIQQRRALYKPQNKILRDLLHTIPPSETCLFAEPQLSELVKEQGGITKLFPGKFRRSTTSTFATTKAYRDKRPQPSASEAKEKFHQNNQNKNTAARKPERSRYQTKRAPDRRSRNKKY